jgi:CheY-specific phosphatase CheX
VNSSNAEVQPVPQPIREQLLDPFIEAACGTLRDWAQTEAAVRTTHRQTRPPAFGDLWAALELTFADDRGILVIGMAAPTAAALARRILAETTREVNDTLVCDCVGELANVTAGQAKALLHGTPRWFRLGTPRVAPADIAWPAPDCLVAMLGTDLGDIALRLCVQL